MFLYSFENVYCFGLPDDTTLKKFYYCQHKLTNQGLVRYDAIEILTDVLVCQIISSKFQFLFNTMIKLYAKFRRSMKEIMMLLNPPIANTHTK